MILGLPALVAAQVFQMRYLGKGWSQSRPVLGLLAFGAGSIAVILSTGLFFSLVMLTLPAGLDAATERIALYGLLTAHGPLALLEGGMTTGLVLFLQRVKPELLNHEA
jgi:cobalt/nickel transport system permease protein